MDAVTEAYGRAFSRPRHPRSVAYKAGVMAALQRRIGNGHPIVSPFDAGTAEADAFWSGVEEGKLHARDYKASRSPGSGA